LKPIKEEDGNSHQPSAISLQWMHSLGTPKAKAFNAKDAKYAKAGY
jgi:hypothetical protein